MVGRHHLQRLLQLYHTLPQVLRKAEGSKLQDQETVYWQAQSVGAHLGLRLSVLLHADIGRHVLLGVFLPDPHEHHPGGSLSHLLLQRRHAHHHHKAAERSVEEHTDYLFKEVLVCDCLLHFALHTGKVHLLPVLHQKLGSLDPASAHRHQRNICVELQLFTVFGLSLQHHPLVHYLRPGRDTDHHLQDLHLYCLEFLHHELYQSGHPGPARNHPGKGQTPNHFVSGGDQRTLLSESVLRLGHHHLGLQLPVVLHKSRNHRADSNGPVGPFLKEVNRYRVDPQPHLPLWELPHHPDQQIPGHHYLARPGFHQRDQLYLAADRVLNRERVLRQDICAQCCQLLFHRPLLLPLEYIGHTSEQQCEGEHLGIGSKQSRQQSNSTLPEGQSEC
jgi:hypothetical protein